jgi:hypothetical protein
VAREIVSDDLFRQALIENFRGASRLDRTARKHSNHRSAGIDTLGQHFRVLPLVLASEQCAEVLNALAVRRIRWLALGTAQLAAGRQFDTIRREPISDQHHTHAFSHLAVVECGNQDAAHVSPFLAVCDAGTDLIRFYALPV